VKRKTPTNLVASVSDRLRIIAQGQSEQLQNVLNRYGLERWLYRLCQSSHRERFVLKGAMLFTLWSEEPHRRTRDLDLLGFGSSSIAEWEQIFREICRIKVEPDGLEMLAETVRGEMIRVEEEYAGVRIKLMAMLGKARIPLQIDIGFGDAVTPAPQEIAFPTILDFPAPFLRAYRPETVIAEKFHAMVDHGLRNTRMKDYYDIWKLSQQFEFNGEVMVEAFRATFARRQTALPADAPIGLTDKFSLDPLKISQWKAFLRKSGLSDQEMSLSEIVSLLENFLLPPVQAAQTGERFLRRWILAGSWEVTAQMDSAEVSEEGEKP
jgi:predicted nucleotidyltransferase component of viral defense system